MNSRSTPLPGAQYQARHSSNESVHRRAKAAWARLIKKIYEVDPLVCARCGAEMWVIALIEKPAAIQRILKHLGAWDPHPSGPRPAASAECLAKRGHLAADLSFGA